MLALLTLLGAVFGAIIGSFLNVVILRYNTGRTLTGRSACFSCSRPLTWYELIPIISFVLQGARCRSCGSGISYQYPLVEIATAALFASIALRWFEGTLDTFFLVHTLFYMAVFSLLIVIVVYDMRHTIIPEVPVYLLIALSFLWLFVGAELFVTPSLPELAAGPVAALPLALLWFFSRGRAMGLGDAKLALGLGWIAGLSGAFSMLILSFWIGALLSLARIALWHVVHGTQLFGARSRLTMKSEVAFGPFIVAAFLIVIFFEFDLAAFLY